MKKTTLAMAMMVAMGWQAPALADAVLDDMTMEERMQRMEQRMQYLEDRVRDQDRVIKEKDARIEQQDERIEQLVSDPRIRKEGVEHGGGWFQDVTVSGLIEVEGSATDNEDLFDDAANGDNSDIVLATAELGVEAQVHDWVSGNITFLYEEDDTDLEVDVATIAIANADASPFYFIGGQMYVPFGVYETNMISDPFTLEIGETRETAALVGFEHSGFYGNAYLFNGDTDKSGDDDEIDNFGANAGYAGEFANGDFDVSVSYINDIGDSDNLQDVVPGGGVDDEVDGLGVSAVANIGDFTLIGEYVTALDDFDDDEIYTGDNGAEPSAWNLEAGYNFMMMGKESTVAVAYQETDDLVGLLPEERLSLGLSIGIFEDTALSFEYAADDDYGSSDGGTGDDAWVFTTQLAYEF